MNNSNLLTIDEKKLISVDNENFFEKMKENFIIISIIGRHQTGKSTLLNLLYNIFGDEKDFQSVPEIFQAEFNSLELVTKGINISNHPIKFQYVDFDFLLLEIFINFFYNFLNTF